MLHLGGWAESIGLAGVEAAMRAENAAVSRRGGLAPRIEGRVAMQDEIVVVFRPDGTFKAVYDDAFPFAGLGALKARRAGSVSWDEEEQGWVSTLTDGRQSGPFTLRADAVAWELSAATEAMVSMEAAKPSVQSM